MDVPASATEGEHGAIGRRGRLAVVEFVDDHGLELELDRIVPAIGVEHRIGLVILGRFRFGRTIVPILGRFHFGRAIVPILGRLRGLLLQAYSDHILTG